ncbi:hypothetical protein [uncultured Algibacter sp.]|uniref:hypothetical protein n=1 Tax=uncultured Algibacter sp. TaxID=298659 RepID=UPI00260A6DB9|nr:hypothetical protein [uncultured Algibacter sp.]
MKNYLFHIGIDISKLKLDVVLIDKRGTALNTHFVVTNTTKGLKRMFNLLKKQGIDFNRPYFVLRIQVFTRFL